MSPATTTATTPSEHENRTKDDVVWQQLVDWVTANGGAVHASLHASLELKSRQDEERGVFCRNSSIAVGETLIRLPAQLVLHGAAMPREYDYHHHNNNNSSSNSSNIQASSSRQQASGWLRCLAAYYQQQQQQQQTHHEAAGSSSSTCCSFAPYLASLPVACETLWKWSNDEIRSYLCGTSSPAGWSVGWAVDPLLVQERYRNQIRPYLEQCRVLQGGSTKSTSCSNKEDDDHTVTRDEYTRFAKASQILSTRCFHLSTTPMAATAGSDCCPSSSTTPPPQQQQQQKDDDDDDYSSYAGPFLLPVMDLLNHSHTTAATCCTRLQRTTDNSFIMIANRTIPTGDEILHSYGDDLTASQFLQTFGFVPRSTMMQAVAAAAATQGAVRAETNATLSTPITPAILSQQMVLDACWNVIESSLPQQLAQFMQEKAMPDDVWTVSVDRSRDTSFLANEIMICPAAPSSRHSESSESALPDELVTLACLPFLPVCAYREAARTMLDRSILQDYFLGKLVCTAILKAIRSKLATYSPIAFPDGEPTTTTTTTTDDATLLRELLLQMSQESRHDVSLHRLAYGLTVRLEEKQSLAAARREVIGILASLDEEAEYDVAAAPEFEDEPKRQRRMI